jgi:uncharacterized protein YndB with AHSA1/START domain
MTEGARDAREGTLERSEEGRWSLRFERRLPQAPEKVWHALTEEEHLAAWFPTTIEGELREGAELQFRFRGEEAPPTRGEMLTYDPPRVMEFTWGQTGEDVDQPERTRFELVPEGSGSRLTMTTTYDQVGKSARDAAGWHICLDGLEGHVAGESVDERAHERWRPLNRRYTEKFGPESATIGPPPGALPDEAA